MEQREIRLIRHATGTHMANPNIVVGRADEATLTSQGLLESAKKGLQLREQGYSPDVIVSSPSERCQRTAEFVLFALRVDKPVELASDIIEMDQGDAVGMLRSEAYGAATLEQIALRGFDFSFPRAESVNQVGIRGVRWADQQKNRQDAPGSILAFSHGGLITCMAARLEGWNYDQYLEKRLSIKPVSETRLVLDNDRWRLDYFARPLTS